MNTRITTRIITYSFTTFPLAPMMGILVALQIVHASIELGATVAFILLLLPANVNFHMSLSILLPAKYLAACRAAKITLRYVLASRIPGPASYEFLRLIVLGR